MASEEHKTQAAGPTITPVQHMISACTGAILTSLMMTPFDVVKIRLQSQAKPSSFADGKCFLYCNGLMDHLCPCGNGPAAEWYKRPGKFNGTLDALVKIVLVLYVLQDALVKIVRYEGLTSLWSGLPPTLVMAIPSTVVYFTSYEHLKKVLAYHESHSGDRWKPMVAGSVARVWAASLISPIEMVRTKMQSKRLKYSEIRTAVRDTVRHNGLLSLYRGLGPTLLRDVPFSAIYWTGYETFKSYILTTTGHPTLSFHESFGSGALAGSVAAILTLPFDVIKTRRQIELGELVLGSRKEPTSTWIIIRKIYSSEGFKALYTGLPPRLMKVAPACAIMISTFEYFKRFFASRTPPRQLDGDGI
ncbi:hypothetical protein BsWGS_09276 [Bradybaena similaris]